VKKLIVSVVLALSLVLSLGLPVLAESVSTGVEVTQGGGNIPVIKCKWETPDHDPTQPYTQVNPPCTYQGTQEVCVWVVVTDVEDQGEVAQVVADIYHPDGPPECGSMKYGNLELVMVDRLSEGIPEFMSAAAGDLVHYASPFDYDEVLFELEEGVAQVWRGCFLEDYHQPAGDYSIDVYAVDSHANVSEVITNTFEYVATTAFEVDFTSVAYPTTMMSSHVWTLGDRTFGTADRPTVRNLGNTCINLWVEQDDMGFGSYDSGEYKVEYDARLGNDTGNNTVYYDPCEKVMIPDTLPLCNTQKLDFSIHVKFALPGTYGGTMTLSCSEVPFDCCYLPCGEPPQ
jgi:hypothetical protein